MSNWIVKAKDKGAAACNIVKSVGPFMISQSEKMSEAFARHKGRLASVEVAKELLIDEGKILNKARGELLERYAQADAVEKIRIRGDLEDISGYQQQLNVSEKALGYFPQAQDTQGHEESTREIADHWMDSFSELAKRRNEKWREELLSKALAFEAAEPGSITTKVLWFVGTMEERTFHAVSSLLDLCCIINKEHFIPAVSGHHKLNEVVPDCPLREKIELGELLLILDDSGVVTDFSKTVLYIETCESFSASYLKTSYRLKRVGEKDKMEIKGIGLTTLGESIARLHSQRYNELG